MHSQPEENQQIKRDHSDRRRRERENLWTDSPIQGAEQDQLNFSHYADVLTDVVLTTNTPITIGIFGPWGSGKTSLMRLIGHKLEGSRTEDHRWARVVWFNAWQYERDEGALWRTLLLRVLEALEDDHLSDTDARRIQDWQTRLYADVQRVETGSIQIDWPKLGKGAISLGLSLIPTPSTLLQLAKLLQDKRSSLEEVLAAFQREQTEIYRRQLTLLEEFRDGFAHLVKEYIQSRNGVLVLFIDDLDRCLPERAVEVLEAIKLFLDVPGCVFFMAVDLDVIEQVVRHQYTAHLNEDDEAASQVSGQSYLEKIVQLPFNLPPLEEDQMADYIAQYEPHLQQPCRDAMALGLKPNPRVVKRTLNIFRLLMKLAQRRVEAGTMEPIEPALLAKMVVIQARYRDLYHDLLEYPNLIQDLEWAAREGIEVKSAIPPLTEETPETATLLERYLRYKPLLRMLRIEPLFANLTRQQINAYIYLTRTTSEDPSQAPETNADRLWEDLLSNDHTRLQAAITTVKSERLTDDYVSALMQLLQPGTEATTSERISAGIALAHLGDPRDFGEMIDIPGGEFKHGKNGEPTYVMAYRISRYPVTNAQYARFLAENPAHRVPYIDEVWAEPYNWNPKTRMYPPGKANHPVVLVSWKDTLAYCKWAGVRLPNEEEWARAARGEDGRIYPWGDKFHTDRANVRESGIGSTTPVGVYPAGASPYGLLDCAGNVWEWTSTRQGKNRIIIRGGSWNFRAQDARCFSREFSHPDHRSNRIGFRVVTGPRPRRREAYSKGTAEVDS